MRLLPATLLLATLATAGDSYLADMPDSSRAGAQRQAADTLWAQVLPVVEKLRQGEEVAPERIVEAIARIEEAALQWERSLEKQWHSAANRSLADAVKAYFFLRERLPPAPEPADAEAKEKAEKEATRARKARERDARRFVVRYGQARKFRKLFGRCDRCDGRGQLQSAFGDKKPCPVCQTIGTRPVFRGVVNAHWMVFSPLYRADARLEAGVDRKLRSAQSDPNRLAPFVRSLSVTDVEDHGLFVRVRVKETIQHARDDKKTEVVKTTHIVYPIGRLWYLHSHRHDRALFHVPVEEEADADG